MTETQEVIYPNNFDLYTKTLNYNVIGRYDPKIKQLLFHTSHCQLYKFNQDQEWEKLDYQGVLAIYSRNTTIEEGDNSSDDLYNHGMIILNRTSPDNFSLGLIPNEISKKLEISEIKIEYQTDYIIVKNLIGEIYGFWIHEINDRETVLSLVKAILSSSSYNDTNSEPPIDTTTS